MTDISDIDKPFDAVFLNVGRGHCAARIYNPARGKAKGGGIVLAPGFGGTMDSGLFGYAEAFAKAGFYTLVFDYQGFGESPGGARQMVSVAKQKADWRAAIMTLRHHAGVDAHRIGLWGMDFSAGLAAHVATEDGDIPAIVMQNPMLDFHLWRSTLDFNRGQGNTDRLAQIIRKDVWPVKLGQRQAQMLPLLPDDTDIPAIYGAAASAMADIAGASWVNAISTKSFVRGALHKNDAVGVTGDLVDRLGVPVLVQMSRESSLVSHEAVHGFLRRMGPLARHSEYAGGHFDLLTKSKRKSAIIEAVAFFREILGR